MLTRPPSPALRPFVRRLWVAEEASAGPTARERLLPSGAMHLVFRLSDHPLRVFAHADDPTGRLVAHAVVGGVRTGPYVRDTSMPVRSLGAMLVPGAAEALLGAPADELAGRHTVLEDLWGRAAAATRERLADVGDPARTLELFEALLAARLPRLRGLHPAVAHGLARFATTADVRAVVRESGYSHRRFIAVFRRAVGVAPKVHCRLARFQRALARLAVPTEPLVAVALAAGYGDQPHFTREFRAFAGLSPGAFRAAAPTETHHVPILPRGRVNSVQDDR